jgi:FkbM family methyltransferase
LSDISTSYNSPLGRLLRLPLKLIPPNAQVRIVQGPLRGKYWIHKSSSAGCWLGTAEAKKLQIFAHTITRGSVVFDLGANVGLYSLLAGTLVGPEGKVFSFEPVPDNIRFLRKHLEINKVTNCVIWETAVGKTEGTAYFDRGPNRFAGHLSGQSEHSLGVQVIVLDNLVSSGELPPPDFIKCDIEGGEFDALSGTSGTLEKYGPTIFLATHGPEVHQQCLKLLRRLGYQLTSLDERSVEQTSELVATRK